MYHSQRERTQGYRAPIANGTYNSTMISKNNEKNYNEIQDLRPNMNCPYPAHICKPNQPHLKPIIWVQNSVTDRDMILYPVQPYHLSVMTRRHGLD